MNDQYDNERTDREMLDRVTAITDNHCRACALSGCGACDEYPRCQQPQPLLTEEERKLRARACRGFSQRRLDFGEISAIRAFLTGNSDECPPEYREAYRAEQERAARGGRHVYVYRLVVEYPQGSLEQGWEPPLYRDREWRRQLPLRERLRLSVGGGRRFSWPKERQFLSSDGAWARAWWLKACGAEVTILRSQPVTWVDAEPRESFAGIRLNW